MERTMRWLRGLIVLVVFLAPMAACSKPSERTSRTEGAGTAGASQAIDDTVDTAAEHRLLELVRTPWVGDLDGMLERRLIRILIVPSRTMYFLEQGKPRGIIAEFQAAFETYIDKRFPPKARHLKTNVVVVPTSRDGLLPALLEGRGDIAAANLTITPGRQAQVDFSAPTSGEVNEIVVTGPASPELAGLGDLAGKEIMVRRSSSYWEHLEKLNQRFRAERKKPIRLVPVPEELRDEDLMEMVNAGLLETTVVDDYKAELWAKILPDIRLHPDIAISSGKRFGCMMRKGSPLLKEALNTFIERHRPGTSFGNTVIRRYVGSTKFVKPATSAAEVKKFDALVGLFRRYGERYGLDYLLLMAQGYQESRLDQRAHSRAGAVGIMQVLPSTGRELKVGNVRELEPNIHAGAKYIRRIIDEFFADDAIDDLNKTLFAFASYNGGPNRIVRIRGATRERGLDPNIWFGNVELVVAQKVGPQPVTYVSSIFKYYVAFKLMEQDRKAQQGAREKFEGSVQ